MTTRTTTPNLQAGDIIGMRRYGHEHDVVRAVTHFGGFTYKVDVTRTLPNGEVVEDFFYSGSSAIHLVIGRSK